MIRLLLLVVVAFVGLLCTSLCVWWFVFGRNAQQLERQNRRDS